MIIQNLHYLNMIFGAGAIVLLVLSLGALILLLLRPKESRYLAFIKEHFIEIGFLISLSALVVSSFYSEVVGFIPCKHCWIQRIFIIPQTFLFAVAWIRKERSVFWYSWPLLVVGFLDSVYLIHIYYVNPSTVPCDASGVSCVQQLVSEFGGYISIPSLSFIGFLSLLILLLVSYFYKKGE